MMRRRHVHAIVWGAALLGAAAVVGCEPADDGAVQGIETMDLDGSARLERDALPAEDTGVERPVDRRPPNGRHGQPRPPNASGRLVPPPTRVPAGPRTIAIGDLHGDFRSMADALLTAGVVDPFLHWNGGQTVVVQVGDQLDRGDDEKQILDFLEVLADEAHLAGGAVYPLLGNHETMNVDLDYRYVTAGGYVDFDDTSFDPADPFLRDFSPPSHGRVSAFRPGGPYARLLAEHNLVMVVGDTVFVHGGVLPELVAHGLAQANADTQAWMRDERDRPGFLDGDNSPVWSRHYSAETDAEDCALLEQVLDAIPAERMVVAHTVQPEGINSACQDRVWRVDVGLANYYGGGTAVLEIVGDDIQILTPR